MMVVSRVCYLSYYKVIYILIGNSRPAKPEKVKVTKTNFISFEHNDDQKTFANLFFVWVQMCVVYGQLPIYFDPAIANTILECTYTHVHIH